MPTDKTIDFVVMFLVLGMLTLGLGSMLIGWIVRQWDTLMLRFGGGSVAQTGDDDRANRAFLTEETNSESAETQRRIAEIRAEHFTFGETEALARLVASGKLGLTDAVKIGADAKSGEKYQRRSREIKARVDALKDKYPQRTPEQAQKREELGIPRS